MPATTLARACEGNAHAVHPYGSPMAEDLTASFGAEPQPESGVRRPPGNASDAPGARIGPYKLLEVVGEGGFGSVYLAEQTEPVKRRVAVKLIKPGMDSRGVIARFETERQVLALMDHPGIATVLDAGQTPQGRPYFVMEYVRGRPITEYCDAASLDIRQRVELMRRVCHAVQHAHQKGIIHRDLKPSNVLVATSDGEASPKVIDFGISKAVASSSTDSEAYTGMHQMLGTPAYMSPEQAGGASHEVDTRSDVYSLGAMMYELFAGSTPIRADDFKGLGIQEMHSRIATEAVTAMAARIGEIAAEANRIAQQRASGLDHLRQQLRGDLNWIVLKCLEKDPGRRYETVAALAADLQRYLNHQAVLAGPPSRVYRLKKFVQRRRFEVAAVGALACALVLGFAGTAVAWARAEEESSRLRFTLSFFSDALTGVTRESSVVPIWSENPSLTLGAALAQSEDLIGDTFEHEPGLEATIRQLVGLAQLRGGEFADATLQLARAYELRESEMGADHQRTLELLLPMAEARSKSGDIQGAIALAGDAYRRYADAFGEASEQTRAVALWNARWFASGYRFAEAERYFDLAELDVAGTSDLSDPITLAAVVERTSTLVGEGELARAEAGLRVAKPQIDRLDVGSDKIRKLFMRHFGHVLTLRGKPDEAVELLEFERDVDDDLQDRVRLRLLAWSLGHAGRTDESEQLFGELLRLEHDRPGPAFRLIFLRLYKADVLLRRGDYAAAASQADAAIEAYDANGFPNDPDRLWGRLISARAWIEIGDLERASGALGEADELILRFPEYRLHVPELRFAQAKLAWAQNDVSEAGELAQAALELAITVFGPDHPLPAEIRTWLVSTSDDAQPAPDTRGT